MTKIKAHPIMIAAVMKVRPSKRKLAARVAEVAFLAALARLNQFADYSRQTNVEMAAHAAAAEVEYKFA